MSDKKEPRHCDAIVDDYNAPNVLRWYLLINRLTADLKCVAREMGVEPRLFADYKGKRVRVVMASRFGDVGITPNLNAENGYDKRVAVDDLTNFSDKE